MVAHMPRITLPLVIALLASFPAYGAERRFSVTDFDRVVVEGPYIVRLVKGRSSSASAQGTQEALDRASVDVSGRTLRIRRNRNYWGGTPGSQQSPLTIELVTREIRGARLIGFLCRDRHVRFELGVVVPAAMVKLDEPHAALGESAGQEAVAGEAAVAGLLDAVRLQHVLRLL